MADARPVLGKEIISPGGNTILWRRQVCVSTRGAIEQAIKEAIQQFDACSIQEAIELALVDWHTRQAQMAADLKTIKEQLAATKAN